MKWGVASLQLLAKYPQLLALLIGQIETLIRRIAIRQLWAITTCLIFVAFNI